MNANEAAFWDVVRRDYGDVLSDCVRALLATPGPLEITADALAGRCGVSKKQASDLLGRLTDSDILQRTERLVCPKCRHTLEHQETRAEACPYCSHPLIEEPAISAEIFTKEGLRTRDVRWMLTLHGMNTQGAWQEDLNWLVSKTYGRMVPVAIYKYGLVRPGAFFQFRHRQLVKQLKNRIIRLSGETKDSGFGSKPDVIAHSLGTLLLGKLLICDPQIQIGRVILTGSILRPDFDWHLLLQRGQVEAVLNHYGDKDFWARVAQFFIPDSGPSGRIGFNDRETVLNVLAPRFTHSQFFANRILSEQFSRLWSEFLTAPKNELPQLQPSTQNLQHWTPAPVLVRAATRALLVLTMILMAVLALLIIVFGISDLVSLAGRFL